MPRKKESLNFRCEGLAQSCTFSARAQAPSVSCRPSTCDEARLLPVKDENACPSQEVYTQGFHSGICHKSCMQFSDTHFAGVTVRCEFQIRKK